MRPYLYLSFLLLALTACAGAIMAPTMADDPYKDADQNTSALTSKEQNLLRLARSTRAGGDDVAAMKLYRDAINQSKGSIRAHLELADLLNAQKNYNGEMKILREAQALQPKNADVVRMIGNTQLAMQTPTQALDSFNKAIALAPKDGRAYSSKGVALDTLGRHTEAQQAYRAGLKVAPKDNEYLANNLALSLILEDKYDDAIVLLEPLATAENATPTLRQNLAMAYALSGKKDKAMEMGLKDLSRKEAEENLKLYTRYMQQMPAKPKDKVDTAVEKVETKPLPKTLPTKPKKESLLKPDDAAKPTAAAEPKTDEKKHTPQKSDAKKDGTLTDSDKEIIKKEDQKDAGKPDEKTKE